MGIKGLTHPEEEPVKAIEEEPPKKIQFSDRLKDFYSIPRSKHKPSPENPKTKKRNKTAKLSRKHNYQRRKK